MMNFIKWLPGFLSQAPAPTPDPKAEQEAFFLTRLPPEIRVLIYKLIFGRDIIHLLHNKGQISHLRIPLRSKTRSSEVYSIYDSSSSVQKPQISSLLQTCRQIHKEAAPLFYSTPVFRVALQETWNIFAKVIGPENLSHVRSLRAPTHLQAQSSFGVVSSNNSQPKTAQLLWALVAGSYKDDERKIYDEFCDILASGMHGLKDLMLVLVSLPEGQARSLEAEWHGPFRKLRGLQKFSLVIRNKIDEEAEDTKVLVRFLKETACTQRSEAAVRL